MTQIDIVQMVRDSVEQKVTEEVERHIQTIERATYFMTTKEVLSYVGMSRNSFFEHIVSDPNFNALIRLGSKHLYSRKELDLYLDKFFVAVRDSGGDIQKYTKR